MNINSVVFPQKLLISQSQVSLRWFIKTQPLSPPLLSGSALCHPCVRWTECVITGATEIPEQSKDKKAEGAQRLARGATASQLPRRGARTTGQEDHTPGQGLLPWLLIPLPPAPRSQASQTLLATGGVEEKHGTTVALRLGSTEATVGFPCLMVGDDDDCRWVFSHPHMDTPLSDTYVTWPDVSSAAVAQGQHSEVKKTIKLHAVILKSLSTEKA